MAQACLVARFEQSRSQMSMYLDCCSDGYVAELIGSMFDEPHVPSFKLIIGGEGSGL
jgi:hypothetical protein